MPKSIFSTSGSKLVYDGTTYYLTSLTYDIKADKKDVTDTGTAGDGKEYVFTRVERTFSAELWKDSSQLTPALKTKKALTLYFEGNRWIGSGSLDSISVKGTLDDGIKLSVNGMFEGAVSESLS